MATKLNQLVGIRLKAARSRAGLTQEQLAEKVDRTKEAISNVERGHNLPTLETLERMCSVLNVPLDAILKEGEGTARRIKALAEIDLALTGLNDDDVTMISDIIKLVSKRSI